MEINVDDENAGTPDPVDDTPVDAGIPPTGEDAGTPGPTDDTPIDAGTPPSGDDAGTPGPDVAITFDDPGTPDGGATPPPVEIVFGDDEAEVIQGEVQNWQQILIDTLLGPPPDDGPQLWNSGPPEDPTDREAWEQYMEHVIELMKELKQEMEREEVPPIIEIPDPILD